MKKCRTILTVAGILAACLFSADCLMAADPGNTDKEREEKPAYEKRQGGYRGFSGGMMLHTGYVGSKDLNITSLQGTVHKQKVGGAPVGIGGAIKLMFGRHFRIGVEGYVSTLYYGRHDSHAKTGWGGILADCVWKFGKWNIFAGGTIGGGSQTNITIMSEIYDDYIAEENVSYRKYGFAAIAPFVGAEYAVTPRINIVMKVDYLLNVTNPADDFVTGPRIYIGFMFGHS